MNPRILLIALSLVTFFSSSSSYAVHDGTRETRDIRIGYTLAPGETRTFRITSQPVLLRKVYLQLEAYHHASDIELIVNGNNQTDPPMHIPAYDPSYEVLIYNGDEYTDIITLRNVLGGRTHFYSVTIIFDYPDQESSGQLTSSQRTTSTRQGQLPFKELPGPTAVHQMTVAQLALAVIQTTELVESCVSDDNTVSKIRPIQKAARDLYSRALGSGTNGTKTRTAASALYGKLTSASTLIQECLYENTAEVDGNRCDNLGTLLATYTYALE